MRMKVGSVLMAFAIIVLLSVSVQNACSTTHCKTCADPSVCTECDAAHQRTINTGDNTCDCNPGYYDDGSNAVCPQCSHECATCQISDTNCLTCATSTLARGATPGCACPVGSYDDGSNAQCPACHYSCQACESGSSADGTACTDCDEVADHRTFDSGNKKCNCNPGYYDDGSNAVCPQCSHECATCQTSDTNCLTCATSTLTRVATPGCACPVRSYDDGSNAQCVACHYSCKTCTSSSSCSSCDGTNYRETDTANNLCKCMIKYYDTGASAELCVACHGTCQRCSGAGDTDCTECDTSKRNLNSGTGECDCLEGTYDNSGTCETCHGSCKSCSGAADNLCTGCEADDHRSNTHWAGASAGTCLCEDGFYEVPSTTTCTPCHFTCSKCTATECTQCTTASKTTLVDGLCECQSTQYWDSGTLTCQTCSYACKSCSKSDTNCTGCDSTHFRSLESNKCNCNTGYYDDGSAGLCKQCDYACMTCTSTGSCDSCNANMFRVKSGTGCICQDGYWETAADEKQLCTKCHDSCKTCAAANQCSTCRSGSNRQVATANTLCTCKDKYYQNGSTKPCQSCKYSCATCIGPNTCATCDSASNRGLDSATKQCLCNAGFYDNGAEEACVACHSTCKTCQNNSQCLTCDADTQFRILDSNSPQLCICKDGYVDVSSTCTLCHPTCLTCSGISQTQCLTCDDSKDRYKESDNSCKCKSGFYEDTTCKQCDHSCVTCSSGTTCTTCGLLREGGSDSALCTCLDKYYSNATNDQCHSCHYSCKTCTQDNVCVNCDATKFREFDQHNELCICKQKYYDDGTNQLCLACSFTCKTCATSGSCLACSTASNRHKPTDNCPCIDRYYSIADTQTCSSCDHSCKTCIKANECTSCNADKFREYDQGTKKCICKDGYFDNGSDQLCVPCHYSCEKCSPDAVTCTSCKSSAFRTLNTDKCDCNQYYFDDQANQQCKACHYSCATCSSTTACLTCNDPDDHRESGSDGLCKCKDGYYNDGTNRICVKCHVSCVTCVDGDTCSSCEASNNRELNSTNDYSGNPQPYCPCLLSYYPNSDTTCAQCHYSCEVCDGATASDCLHCEAAKERELVDKACKCKTGFYDDSSSELCKECSSNCVTCSGATATCLTCDPLKHRQLNTDDDTCDCKQYYFEDDSQVCQPCHHSCATCSSTTACLTCNDPDDHRESGSDGLCKCKDGYYNDGTNRVCVKCHVSCVTCVDGDTCSSCEASNNRELNSTDDYNGNPQPYCPCLLSYYPDSDTTCAQCHYSCEVCDGATASDCLHCEAAKERELVDKACKCKTGFYDDGTNQLCLPCNNLCKKCVGPSFSDCSQCSSSIFYLLSSTSCYATCPQTFYDQQSTYTCQKCSDNCLTCENSTKCLTCETSHALYQDACVKSCPIRSTYEDIEKNECIQCPDHCLTCSSSLKCSTCETNYYLDELYPLCFPCHSTCKGCFGSAQNQCKDCQYPLYFNENQCIPISCSYGQYVDSYQGCIDCTQKFSNSLTCNIDEALLCKEDYKLTNGKCILCNLSGTHLMSLGKCSQVCGDGQLFELQCDDGNRQKGDGCSSNCLIEKGWRCQTLNGISSCQISGDVGIQVSEYYKFGGQNKIRINMLVSMSIKFDAGLFNVLIGQSSENFSWKFSQDENDLTKIVLVLNFKSNIQNKQLKISYGASSRRLLAITINFSENFVIETYPPANFYSDQQIKQFQTIHNTIYYLSIVLMCLCALALFFPKRMYLNVITYAYIPVQLYIIFGLNSENITDWIKSSLKDLALPSIIYGFKIYECCKTSEFFGYSTNITVNYGIVIAVMLGLWLIYGVIAIVNKNISDLDPRIRMYSRTFLITIQLCVFFHLVYTAMNSLFSSSLTYGQNPVNACIGIFIMVFSSAFILWLWVLSYYNEPVEFSEFDLLDVEKIQKIQKSRLENANILFELENKTFNGEGSSLNQTNKDFYHSQSSRSDLQFDHKEKAFESKIIPMKESPYKIIENRYYKQWLIFDYIQGYKVDKISKYYLPFTVTKIFAIAIIACVLQNNLYAMFITIIAIHSVYTLAVIIIRPFKFVFTTIRICLLEIFWIALGGLMLNEVIKYEQNNYDQDREKTILIIIASFLGVSTGLLVIEIIASWRYEIWNRIQPCLIALRLRNPRKVHDIAYKFSKPEQPNKKSILKVEDIAEQNEGLKQKKNKESREKEQAEQLDAFFSRMLKKQRLYRQFRRERLMKQKNKGSS